MPWLRRLRAVLLLSVVSAVMWGVVGTISVLIIAAISGERPRMTMLTAPFLIFGTLGFAAGALWSAAIGLLGAQQDRDGVSAWRAGLLGALFGVLVFVGAAAWIGGPPIHQLWRLLIPAMCFGAIGTVTGLAIQRTATRGEIGAGEATVRAIKS